MAALDFENDFTEVDPDGVIAISGEVITVTDIGGDHTAYVYKDFGVDYFDEQVLARMKVNIASGVDDGAEVALCVLANMTGDLQAIEAASGDYIAAMVYGDGAAVKLKTIECAAGVITETVGDTISALDTDCWLTLERDESAASSYVFCNLYEDNHELTYDAHCPVLTLTDDEDFRYFYPVAGRADETVADVSVTISDCYVGVGEEGSFTATYIFDGNNIPLACFEEAQSALTKTASGRYYGLMWYYQPSTRRVFWVYSDDFGATWNGPYRWGYSASWTPNNINIVALGTTEYDDAMLSHFYTQADYISNATVEGNGYVSYPNGGSVDPDHSTRWNVLMNVQQNNEILRLIPDYTGDDTGIEMWYFPDADDGSAVAVELELGSAGSYPITPWFRYTASVDRDGEYAHCFIGGYSYNLTYVRWDVANRSWGTPDYNVMSNAFSNHNNLCMTMDFDGDFYLAWGDYQDVKKTHFAKFTNNGDGTVTLEKGPIVACNTTAAMWPKGISIDEAGSIYIVCYESGTAYFLVRRSDDGGDTWYTYHRQDSATDQMPIMMTQDPNRAHTYLDEGCLPILFADMTDDYFYCLRDDNQGDYLKRFPDETDDLSDGGDWERKCAITINGEKIPEDLTHFPVIFNTDTLPDELWDYCQPKGQDIRFTRDEAGEERLPVDIRHFDTGEQICSICVSYSGDLVSGEDTTWYVWYGNDDAYPVTLDEDYGKAGVYDDNFRFIWPMTSQGNYYQTDRIEGRHLKPENLAAEDRVTGEIAYRVQYDGVDQEHVLYDMTQSNYYDHEWFVDDWGFTISYIGRCDPAGEDGWSVISQTTENSWNHWLGVRVQPDGKVKMTVDDGTADEYSETTETLNSGEYGWCTGVGESSSNFSAQLNDGDRAGRSGNQNFPTAPSKRYQYGKLSNQHRDGGDRFQVGSFEEIRISTSVRSQGWSAAEYYNIFQQGFLTLGTPGSAGPTPASFRRSMSNIINC